MGLTFEVGKNKSIQCTCYPRLVHLLTVRMLIRAPQEKTAKRAIRFEPQVSRFSVVLLLINFICFGRP